VVEVVITLGDEFKSKKENMGLKSCMVVDLEFSEIMFSCLGRNSTMKGRPNWTIHPFSLTSHVFYSLLNYSTMWIYPSCVLVPTQGILSLESYCYVCTSSQLSIFFLLSVLWVERGNSIWGGLEHHFHDSLAILSARTQYLFSQLLYTFPTFIFSIPINCIFN